MLFILILTMNSQISCQDYNKGHLTYLKESTPVVAIDELGFYNLNKFVEYPHNNHNYLSIYSCRFKCRTLT